jgi:hypothetical protein
LNFSPSTEIFQQIKSRIFVSLGILCDSRTQYMGDNKYIPGERGGQMRKIEE